MGHYECKKCFKRFDDCQCEEAPVVVVARQQPESVNQPYHFDPPEYEVSTTGITSERSHVKQEVVSDDWIGWGWPKSAEPPVDDGTSVDVKILRDGVERTLFNVKPRAYSGDPMSIAWDQVWSGWEILAYRLHQPETKQPEVDNTIQQFSTLAKPKWEGEGLPPVAYLHTVLTYDEHTGELFWKPRQEDEFSLNCHFVSWSKRFSGKSAGTLVKKKKKTYVKINFSGKNYYAHRIAYAMWFGEWPKGEIDHVNGDSTDNSIKNLRQVDRKENCKNISLLSDSKSGYCGVNWHSPSGKWRARVKVDGKEHYVGLFDDPEEAARRIKSVRDALGFHDNHGRPPAHRGRAPAGGSGCSNCQLCIAL